MTVTQLAASRTVTACDNLVAAARSTAPDKLDWSPMANARPVMDQLSTAPTNRDSEIILRPQLTAVAVLLSDTWRVSCRKISVSSGRSGLSGSIPG